MESVETVVGAEDLEFGAAVYLVGGIAVVVGEGEDVVLGEHGAFGELRIEARKFLGHFHGARFAVALSLQAVGGYAGGYEIVDH